LLTRQEMPEVLWVALLTQRRWATWNCRSIRTIDCICKDLPVAR